MAAKRVVVVGGGPGGLEAARLTALAGHEVTLFERSEQLGGQLRIAAAAPHRGDFLRFIDYLKAETQRLGVEILLGHEATFSDITQLGAEFLIVATGAQAIPPDLELKRAGSRVLTAWELLAAPSDAEFGERAVVVDDGTGFWHACSAVESLCERGVSVVLATPANGIGLRIPPESFGPLYERLAGQSVRFAPFTQLEAVDAAGATLLQTLSGKRTHEPADTVVVHGGQQAEDALLRQLVDAEFPVHAIGDCVAPRLLTQAIYEAGEAARGASGREAVGA